MYTSVFDIMLSISEIKFGMFYILILFLNENVKNQKKMTTF